MKYYKIPYSHDVIDEASLAELARKLAGKRVILYGAGCFGDLLNTYFLFRDIDVICFCDRSEEKIAAGYCGRKVIPISEVKGMGGDVIVVIATSRFAAEARQALLDAGVAAERIETPVFITNVHYIKAPIETVDFALTESEGWEEIDETFTPIASRPSKQDGAPNILFFSRVYNVPPHYLRRAIESVLNQTYTNFTYLIVDNGSTDGSAQIIEEYRKADSRMVVETFNDNSRSLSVEQKQKRRGALDTKYFEGRDYICILDSDDYYEPRFLERSLACAIETGADMVNVSTFTYWESTPLERMWIQNNVLGEFTAAGAQMKLNAYRCVGMRSTATWGRLMKGDLYRSSTGDIDLKDGYIGIADTFGFANRYFKSDKIAHIGEMLHCCTIRPYSITQTLSVGSLLCERYVALCIHLKQLMADNNYVIGQYQDILDELLEHFAFGYDYGALEHLAQENGAMAKAIVDNVLRRDLFKEFADNPIVSAGVERLKWLRKNLTDSEAER